MKTTMTALWQGACAGLLLGGAALLSAGCEGVAYTESGPGVYYGYDYYPDQDIYYYPEGHIYYWNEDGYWHSGEYLPPAYHLRGEHREYLRLHSEQPWTEHWEHHEHEEFEHHGDYDHHGDSDEHHDRD